MTPSPLGRLTKIELRQAWANEARDFTPWLAREENLALLGEAIGLELELESLEKPVGPFSADILCKDTENDNWVLIENQLERTDHTHLGQLLTYAAGLQAVTIVWIAQRFTEEHRAALDWLNEHTDDGINLFGLEVELWQIGDSPMAPKFNIISKPNDWSKTVKQAASGELGANGQNQIRFWNAFTKYLEANKSFLKGGKPSARPYMNFSLGVPSIHVNGVITTASTVTKSSTPQMRAQIYIGGSRSKQIFAALEPFKIEIERKLGFPLTWANVDGRKVCRLLTIKDSDFTNESLWPQQFEWLKTTLEKLHQVFCPIVKDLPIED